MKVYSQYCQDFFLNFLFGGKSNGCFLDIGANDGITYSNSYYFEKNKNWSGLCIEPQVDIFQKCKSVRNCHLENVCLSDVEGSVLFRKVYGADMLSGIVDFMDDEAVARIEEYVKSKNSKYEDIRLPSVTLGNLLQKYRISEVDFCSIDVEGAEWAILKMIDFDNLNIRAFVIEGDDENVHALLESKGYMHIKSENDTFFVQRDYFGRIKLLFFRTLVRTYLLYWKIRRRMVKYCLIKYV